MTLHDNMPVKLKKGVVLTLAMILMIYHIAKVFSLYITDSNLEYSTLIHIQSIIRILIVISLSLVIFKKRKALIGMWIAILALIGTQYINVLMYPDPEVSMFAYLKGFIFPIIITLLYPNDQSST